MIKFTTTSTPFVLESRVVTQKASTIL